MDTPTFDYEVIIRWCAAAGAYVARVPALGVRAQGSSAAEAALEAVLAGERKLGKVRRW
jgi:predicted RNase H-like HicB family nuclease